MSGTVQKFKQSSIYPGGFKLLAKSAGDPFILMCVTDENVASHARTLPHFGFIQRWSSATQQNIFTKRFYSILRQSLVSQLLISLNLEVLEALALR